MKRDPQSILAETYQASLQRETYDTGLMTILDWLETIITNGTSFKAVVGVVVTSLTYKIWQPAQDIRMHKRELPGGYSGRTFDTHIVTPFLQKHFPHVAMAESAWLTRSIEQPHAFDMQFPGKIRNVRVKAAFLNLLNAIQAQPELAEAMLVMLYAMLRRATPDLAIPTIAPERTLTILEIAQLVERHINARYDVAGTARLRVLAIHAVYQLMMNSERYRGKVLQLLQSHTTADLKSKSVGDIEIFNSDYTGFEAIEIKHDKPITAQMVSTAYRKFSERRISRYYLLTTSTPNTADDDSVTAEVQRLSALHECEVIVNGVYPTLKYLLRLAPDPLLFIENYSRLMVEEWQNGGTIKPEHIESWQSLLNEKSE